MNKRLAGNMTGDLRFILPDQAVARSNEAFAVTTAAQAVHWLSRLCFAGRFGNARADQNDWVLEHERRG
jgi:hypothetical protein